MSWLDAEISRDEVPPENIWHHPQRLTEWFAAVKQRRDSGHRAIEPDDAPMDHNELVDEVMGR